MRILFESFSAVLFHSHFRILFLLFLMFFANSLFFSQPLKDLPFVVFVVVAIVYTSYCLLESVLSVRLSVSGLVLGSSSFIDPTLWTTLMLRMCMKRWFTTSLLYLMPFLFATNLQFFLDLDEFVWAFDFSVCVYKNK